MNIARSAGWTTVVLGTTTIVLGLALPWTRAGSLHPDLESVAGIAFLGPLLGLLCAAYQRYEPSRWTAIAVVACGGGVAAALIAAGLTRLVEPTAGIGLGGPLTFAGAACAALGWLTVGLTGPRRAQPAGSQPAGSLPAGSLPAGSLPAGSLPAEQRATGPQRLLGDRRALLAVVGVTALLATLAGFGVRWYVDGRFVEHATVRALPVPAADVKPAGVRWRDNRSATAMVGLAGPHLLLREPSGVWAYSAQTGRPTWHYQRSDLPVLATGVVDRAALTVFGADADVLVTAHEVTTGEERFSRRYPIRHPTRVIAAGGLAVLAGSGPDAGDVLALDARGGAVRWRWHPERDGGACDVTGIAAVGDILAVALRCRAKGVDDVLIGLSTSDGRERWAWRAEYAEGTPRGPELAVWAAGPGFLAQFGAAPRHGLFLDAATGQTGTKHTAAGSLSVVAGTAVVYVDSGAAAASLTSVEPRTGRILWQVQLPWLAGWQLLDGTISDTRAYLLLRSREGPLRVVGIDAGDGRVTGDVSVSCALSCDEASIAAGSHSVVVATREPRSPTLTLVALS